MEQPCHVELLETRQRAAQRLAHKLRALLGRPNRHPLPQALRIGFFPLTPYRPAGERGRQTRRECHPHLLASPREGMQNDGAPSSVRTLDEAADPVTCADAA